MPIKPKNTDHYHVFLATPGDMNFERDAVRNFFDRYNHGTARHRGLYFDVVDWKNYASLGLGEPQELISRDTLLRYRESLALVIGLLGQRFGTPTATAESGTEQEFRTALEIREENGDFPEIKWFFRKQWGKEGAPTEPTAMADASAQMQKVLTFKEEMTRGEHRLLYSEFEHSDDFPGILAGDLEAWLNDARRPWNRGSRASGTAAAPIQTATPDAEQWLDAYHRALRTECENLPLEKLGESNATIHLSQVHIPLAVRRPPPKPQHGDFHILKSHALRLERGDGEKEDDMPVLEMLANERLAVLVGGPGSGKSALVNWVTSRLLAPERGSPQELPTVLRELTPVRLVLRRAPDIDRDEDGEWIWHSLQTDIVEKLKPQGQQEASARAHAATGLLRSHTERKPGLLILLDGLDEVTTAGDQRERLIRSIRGFIDTLPEHCRLLLTARPYAYTDPAWQLPGVPEYVLAPMDEEHRAAFIERWHEIGRQPKGWTENEARERAQRLIQTVERRPHLLELARRPLQATLIALLSLRGRLPHDRADLYENAVELLLDRWRSGESGFRGRDNRPVEIPERKLRSALEQLAFEVHREQREEGNNEDAADISAAQLEAVLAPVLKQERVAFDDLLAWLRDHTGILTARSENRFAFPHRAFQEYLAMCWLAARPTEAPVAAQAADDPSWWREVFLLAVASERKTPRNGVQHVTELLQQERQDRFLRARAGVLAGLGLLELELDHRHDEDEYRSARSEARGRLMLLIEEAGLLAAEERAEAGEVLGRLGDPRPGVGCAPSADSGLPQPDFDWVEIPGGPFPAGNGDETIHVDTFHLSRYPVTHAQYQAFLDDPDGYRNPTWWRELDAGPDKPEEAYWQIPNHPRDAVSWYEAMAYCAWASARLECDIRLPTEREWERAACGSDRRRFPCGGDYEAGSANVDESDLENGAYVERTTAVGLYPRGRTTEGVCDLVGNLLEWCLNEYEEPENTGPGGSAMRVLRGGSWSDLPGDARERDRGVPGVRSYDFIGFRVLCAFPMPRAGR